MLTNAENSNVEQLLIINKDEPSSNNCEAGARLTWISKAEDNHDEDGCELQDQQQQLLCITFTSEDGQTHHTETAEPIFIDFSGNQSAGGKINTQDILPRVSDFIGSIDNVSLASLSEDINFETKLKVLDAVLPAPSKDRATIFRTNDSIFICNICETQFLSVEDCKTHCKEHVKRKAWFCELCKLPFKSHSLLTKHNRESHHESEIFSCEKCELIFDRQAQLKYHERRVHLQERSQVCQFCGKGFFKRCDLKMHLNIHLGIMKNICEICGKQFHNRSNLIRHARLHSGVKPYVCCTCGVRFNQVSALKSHKLQRHPVGNKKDGFPCPSCGKVMTTVAVLKKHFKLVHKSNLDSAVFKDSVGISSDGRSCRRKYYCKICGLNFKNVQKLQSHENESHSNAEEFLCKSCNQKFNSIDEIKSHCCVSPIGDDTRLMLKQLLDMQEDMSDEEDFIVKPDIVEPSHNVIRVPASRISSPTRLPIPNPAASDVREMVIHVQAEGQSELMAVHVKYNMNYIFSLDDKILPDATEAVPEPIGKILSEVFEEPVNPVNRPNPEAPAVTKKFKCEDCGNTFNKMHNFKQHLATHNIELKKYTCSVCCQAYAWKSSLNKHIQAHHTEKTGNVLCNLCPKSFNTNQAFNEHVRRDHIGEKSHKCSECGKAFFKKSDLIVHKRIHANEKPYICGNCGKTFSHISHIIRHERIHSGVKPYTCDVCGKTFVQSTTMHVHKKKMHSSTANPKQPTESKDALQKIMSSSAISESEQILENLFDSL